MSSDSQFERDPETLFADYLARVDEGEAESFEAFVARHPQCAEALRALHADWQSFGSVLEKAAPGRLLEDRSPSEGNDGSEPNASGITSDELLRRLAESSSGSGRYRFRALVGRGGMGAILKVWDRELRRPLAMKVVLGKGEEVATGATPRVDERALARFLDEAQITSQLDHPGIVPVHELGTDERGRAYFTMRLVKGEDFEKVIEHVHAGREGWTLTRALNVLVKVCEALAYAHSRGIVHRDIKPANVMVGKYGEAYLMDWGCARNLAEPERRDIRITTTPKATGEVKTLRHDLKQEVPESPLFTMDGDVIGTPAYMSPEQARGDLDQVDVRSDVYSMGALLYHLLAGRAPYLPADASPSPYAVWRWVLETPPKSLDSLAPSAPPELVSIAERAMAREPNGRYPDAVSLARELQAYLDGRVVASHETGTWAETKKWVKRNKALSSALFGALLIAVAGAIAFSIKAEQEEIAARLAQENAKKAEDNAAESRRNAEAAELARRESDENARRAKENEAIASIREQEAKASEKRATKITELLQTSLISSDPNQGGSQDYRVVDAMNTAIAQIENGSLESDPETEAELRTTIAKILVGNGRPGEALALVERALAAPQHSRQENPHQAATRLSEVAFCLVALGRSDEALSKYQIALELFQRVSGGDHPDVASSLNNVGFCLDALGRFEEALPKYQLALEMHERLFGGDHPYVADNLNNVAACLESLGRSEEAMPNFERALQILQQHFSGDAPAVARSLNNIAACLDSMGRSGEALAWYECALQMFQRLFTGDHPEVATTHNNVAYCLEQLGRSEDALPRYQLALEMRRRTFKAVHPDVLSSLNNVACCLDSLGRSDEALPLYHAAVEMSQCLFPADHPSVADGLNNLAYCIEALGRSAEALPKYQLALEMRQRLFDGDHPDIAGSLNNVGSCLVSLHRSGEALPLCERAFEMRWRLFAGDHPAVADSLNNVAYCLEALGRSEEALPKYQLALEMRQRLVGNDHPDVAASLANVALCLASLGRPVEALPLAVRADAIAMRMLPDGHPQRSRIRAAAIATREALVQAKSD